MGKPISLKQQMDSAEFLRNLFDLLENRLKGTEKVSYSTCQFFVPRAKKIIEMFFFPATFVTVDLV